jgi:hypothetical protein
MVIPVKRCDRRREGVLQLCRSGRIRSSHPQLPVCSNISGLSGELGVQLQVTRRFIMIRKGQACWSAVGANVGLLPSLYCWYVRIESLIHSVKAPISASSSKVATLRQLSGDLSPLSGLTSLQSLDLTECRQRGNNSPTERDALGPRSLWPRIWARKISSVWFLGLKRWQQMAP